MIHSMTSPLVDVFNVLCGLAHRWCFVLRSRLVACQPETAEHYKSLVPNGLGLVHLSIEVHHCPLH